MEVKKLTTFKLILLSRSNCVVLGASFWTSFPTSVTGLFIFRLLHSKFDTFEIYVVILVHYITYLFSSTFSSVGKMMYFKVTYFEYKLTMILFQKDWRTRSDEERVVELTDSISKCCRLPCLLRKDSKIEASFDRSPRNRRRDLLVVLRDVEGFYMISNFKLLELTFWHDSGKIPVSRNFKFPEAPLRLHQRPFHLLEKF